MTTDKVLLREIKRHLDDFAKDCQESKKTRGEKGFNVCWDTDKKKTHVLRECSSEGCSVDLGYCKGRSEFGTFHSHPNGDAMPSPQDVRIAIERKEQAFCICNASSKKVGEDKIRKDLGQDYVKMIMHSFGYKVRCFKLTDDKKTRDEFMKKTRGFHFIDEDMRFATRALADAELRPSKKTIYHPILEMK